MEFADYSAVSYVWGELKFSHNLEVQCDDDTLYLRITPNVEALLQHLRDTRAAAMSVD